MESIQKVTVPAFNFHGLLTSKEMVFSRSSSTALLSI